MFGHQLYPTPKHVFLKMADGLRLDHAHVLDPSAGRGDILEYTREKIEDRYGRHYSKLFAIEIDPSLRAVLKDKDFTVIDTDFLQYRGGVQYFDIILMNPPWDEGARHLLKAWSIAHGAKIRCILNAETIKNPYARERKELLAIIEKYNGTVEDLGRCFPDVNAEAVLVSLDHPGSDEEYLKGFDPVRAGLDDFKVGKIENELSLNDPFQAFESRYNAAIEAYKGMLQEWSKVVYYMTGLTSEYRNPKAIIAESIKEGHPQELFQEFSKEFTKTAWDNLFYQSKMSNLLTQKVREELAQMQAKQGGMAFTAANMQALFATMEANEVQIKTDCVLEAFDHMTKYAKGNREAIPGYATNSAYKVGSKVILDHMGGWSGQDGAISWSSRDKIDDIEKAMCFLDGIKFDTIKPVSSFFQNKGDFVYGQKYITRFFEAKFYKKGTLHLRFFDESLRERFNLLVCQERWNILPEKVKKGAYK